MDLVEGDEDSAGLGEGMPLDHGHTLGVRRDWRFAGVLDNDLDLGLEKNSMISTSCCGKTGLK
ncbi:hypothetical protein [Streptomyces sp. NPDC001930]|uniref:hypothetical protein n=1 Tax=Streptomyces sp. NPDC001930 TaxID=3364625 RepID=UPI0036C7D4F8